MEEFLINHATAIAKHILEILLYQPEIIMSWGVDSESIKTTFVENKPGLQFHVQGYKHTGYVQVALCESNESFEIVLLSDDDETVSITKEVLVEILVSTIDGLVEKTEDYENRISTDYPVLTELAKSGNPISIILL